MTSAQNDIFGSDTLSSPRSSAGSTTDSLDNFESNQKAFNQSKAEYVFSERSKTLWKVSFALFGVAIMFFARFNVPSNSIACIEDKLMNAFQGFNNWIHVKENATYRAIFLFACGTQIDIIFFSTLLFWVLYGKTGRLPMSIMIFYGTRAIVQSFWWSPFPSGYYWDSPGFPSFVAPYGNTTDFFFSGHSGFLVLMANEWHKLGYKKMRNYCLINLIYTILVLLVYQAHYSIDIFTGVFFADYVFEQMDKHKGRVDGFWKKFARNAEMLSQIIRSKVVGPTPAVSSLKKVM